MNMKHITALAITTALLSACSSHTDHTSKPHAEHQHKHEHHTHQHNTTVQQAADGEFVCENGVTVNTRYLTNSTGDNQSITLTIGNNITATLPEAQSASGARYFGKGFFGHDTEWHEKHHEAWFSYTTQDKKTVETLCHSALRD